MLGKRENVVVSGRRDDDDGIETQLHLPSLRETECRQPREYLCVASKGLDRQTRKEKGGEKPVASSLLLSHL